MSDLKPTLPILYYDLTIDSFKPKTILFRELSGVNSTHLPYFEYSNVSNHIEIDLIPPKEATWDDLLDNSAKFLADFNKPRYCKPTTIIDTPQGFKNLLESIKTLAPNLYAQAIQAIEPILDNQTAKFRDQLLDIYDGLQEKRVMEKIKLETINGQIQQLLNRRKSAEPPSQNFNRITFDLAELIRHQKKYRQ